MMRIKIMLLALLAGMLTSSFRIIPLPTDDKMEITTAELVSTLHNGGVLLVRLRTSENAIRGLKAQGYSDMADEVQRNQAEENKQIMRAFDTAFDFCPVYFFYSNHTDDVMNQRWNGIFLDTLLHEDSTIQPSLSAYYVAEMGSKATNYDNGSLNGLRLMGPMFETLELTDSPNGGFIWQVSYRKLRFLKTGEMVLMLNERLHKVYNGLEENKK